MNNMINRGEKFAIGETIAYTNQSIVSKVVLKREAGNITLFAFDKGEGLSEHTAPFDAFVHVLDGKVEIIIGGQSYVLDAGEAIIMPANITHALKAIERFKMMLIMIKDK